MPPFNSGDKSQSDRPLAAHRSRSPEEAPALLVQLPSSLASTNKQTPKSTSASGVDIKLTPCQVQLSGLVVTAVAATACPTQPLKRVLCLRQFLPLLRSAFRLPKLTTQRTAMAASWHALVALSGICFSRHRYCRPQTSWARNYSTLTLLGFPKSWNSSLSTCLRWNVGLLLHCQLFTYSFLTIFYHSLLTTLLIHFYLLFCIH